MNTSPAPSVKIQTVVSRPFMENTYVAHLVGRSDCVVIDPGFEPDAILEYLSAERLTPAAILNTHAHADHIAGNEALKRCWPDCPLMIGAKEAYKLTDAEANLSAKYGFSILSPPADRELREDEILSVAGFDFWIRETPGHSSGHIVFVWKGHQPWLVFGGDVLFLDSIGRTDLPDGSFEELSSSIRNKLYSLPSDTIVLPGHGEPTTTGREQRQNPFVRASA